MPNYKFLRVFGDNDIFEIYKLRTFDKQIQTIRVTF